MRSANRDKPIYAIAGPTASGKTTLAVELALRVDGEVINCDSVQIYREIQVATAKPTEEEMRGVPHHLIGYVDPRINYTAGDWARDAAAKISEIESRGKTAILAGGTGFYLRTLCQPLFESPKTDKNLRERLKARLERRGPERLHKILSRLDPDAAARLFPRDHSRVIRALEYLIQTGELFSRQQINRGAPPEFAARIALYVLDPPRKDLYERINARTVQHFDNGLVDEVKHLRAAGVNDDSNALGSHGYRRVCEYLRGERSFEEAIEKTQQDVRNYAKRQRTWFKREESAVWLAGFGEDIAVRDRLFELIGPDKRPVNL